jgi:hypothetical protein
MKPGAGTPGFARYDTVTWEASRDDMRYAPAKSRRRAGVRARVGWRELTLVLLGFTAVTIALTYPLAFELASVGRVDNGDGQFSIWNVAWVARTLVVDPLRVFDANIFYPHRWTLTYSESNLGAGLLAIPAYWATRNPYAAHNFVFLLSFVLSATGSYYLTRYLVRDRRAAAVAAICFAYCPYVFGHTPHIQLMMTAGLPFSLLAFHRLADRPGVGRGVVLGLTMAAQALFCGYYAVFVVLMIGFAILVVAAGRRLWTDARYWIAIAVAAGVAIAAVLPLFLPYLTLQRATGFSRSLDGARQYSADWRTYFASSSHAHAWMLALIGRWGEPLFPGFVALIFGLAGVAIGWFGRWRETVSLYGGLGVLAYWASMGPSAGLYSVLYSAIPVFTLLHAPSRFGLIVALALSVLAGIAIAALLSRFSKPSTALLATFCLGVVAAAELLVPLRFPAVQPPEPAYRVLSTLPRGAVIEMPVFSRRFAFARTQYMLSSTTHWMPLVDAYSDYIPQDFIDHAEVLGGFPSREAFKLLEPDRVRYAVFHLNLYSPAAREALLIQLREFARYLRVCYADDQIWLYEIIGFPR